MRIDDAVGLHYAQQEQICEPQTDVSWRSSYQGERTKEECVRARAALVHLLCIPNIFAWRSMRIRPGGAVRFTWPFWLPEAFWSASTATLVICTQCAARSPYCPQTVVTGALHRVASGGIEAHAPVF